MRSGERGDASQHRRAIMKARTILLLIALTVVMFFAGEHAFGATPDKLLEGKYVEYAGTCRFDAKGNLTFDDNKTKKVEECVVGADPNNDDVKTILVMKENKPARILEYSLSKKTQKTLWINRGS